MTRRAPPQDPSILLIGGGHSHVAVLADWAAKGLPAKRAKLLTPHPYLQYSGMVPGWISGEHERDAGRVGLTGLAHKAGVELVLDRCVAIDPDARSVLTQHHGAVSFDIASIDTGGVGQAKRVLGDDPRLIDVRPIDAFLDQLADFLAQPHKDPLKIAVIGSGAGGLELAFALRNSAMADLRPEVSIVLGDDGPLPGFSYAAKRKVIAEAAAQGIRQFEGNATVSGGSLTARDKSLEPQNVIVAVIGSAAPDWPRKGGLATDEAGFIAVDRYQRSTSHPHILAVGDVAASVDRNVPHSGVHAVHAGPVLAENLRSVIAGHLPQRSYRPRAATLYLISTGTGEAIATYGPFAAQGRWVSRLKAWIDKRWIARYADVSGDAVTSR